MCLVELLPVCMYVCMYICSMYVPCELLHDECMYVCMCARMCLVELLPV
jgi:hypothetical protein